MPVLKDLVPDLTGLYAQYALIEPWLQDGSAARRTASASSRPRSAPKLDGLVGVHPVLLLLDLLPELLVEPGPYLGPSILLQSYRWLADSRDQRPASGSTGSRTRSASIAATRS